MKYPLLKKKDPSWVWGFTLVESIIYIAIFSIAAALLVSVLITVTRTQVEQTSSAELNQQVSFVGDTIQRLVRQSSLIGNATGTPTSTLTLRMSQTALDPTLIYTDVAKTAIYLQQGVGAPIALTTNKVAVQEFIVTKYENPGGFAIAQVDFTLNYNSSNPNAQASKTWKSAIARVSAATFDSSLVPNSSGAYDLGTAASNWKDGYFSGSVGIAVSAPTSGAKLKVAGNIGFTASNEGVILMSPNSTCYRLGVTNSGTITTTTVACP